MYVVKRRHPRSEYVQPPVVPAVVWDAKLTPYLWGTRTPDRRKLGVFELARGIAPLLPPPFDVRLTPYLWGTLTPSRRRLDVRGLPAPHITPIPAAVLVPPAMRAGALMQLLNSYRSGKQAGLEGRHTAGGANDGWIWAQLPPFTDAWLRSYFRVVGGVRLDAAVDGGVRVQSLAMPGVMILMAVETETP